MALREHYRVVYRGGALSMPYFKRSDAYYAVHHLKTAKARNPDALPMCVIRVLPKKENDDVRREEAPR